jgi:hypothetical protein
MTEAELLARYDQICALICTKFSDEIEARFGVTGIVMVHESIPLEQLDEEGEALSAVFRISPEQSYVVASECEGTG